MTTEAPRLLYVDDTPTPYRLGVHRLVARRWPGAFKLLFLARAEPDRRWDFDFEGLDVEILKGFQFRPRGQINPFSFKWNPAIVGQLEIFKPDVVAASGYVHPTIMRAAFWCLNRQIPYGIVCETSGRSTACSGWRWQARRMALAWIVRNMAFGLPVGREAAAYLRCFGPSKAPMYYFPNTPDTAAIVAEAERVRGEGLERELRAALGIASAAPIVLFVGRLIEAKRPMDVLAAFERLGGPVCNMALVIAGDGPLRPALAERASKNNNVFFTGWLRDPTQMAGLMAISRMLVLPSAHEPWGAVVNEALAAGTPVIASDRVSSAVELIEDGVNGFLYDVGDIVALAEKIRAVLTLENAERALMSTAARATAINFGHEFAADNLIKGALAAIRRRGNAEREIA